MGDKVQPLGICDYCGGPINQDWYTSHGKPRRYCSVDCRNAGNSRAGAPIRSTKAKQRIAEGRWVNPRTQMTPEQTHAAASRTARTIRLREVREGRWRNPALSPEARAKLSRPRKLTGVLHQALERIRTGAHIADLSPQQRAAYRLYKHEAWARWRERH